MPAVNDSKTVPRNEIDSFLTWLFDVCRALLYEVFHHVHVSVPAGQDERGGAVGLGGDQLGHLVLGAVVEKNLE